MLKDHGMETANIDQSPLPKAANLLLAQRNKEILNYFGHMKYRSMIKILLYSAVFTNPDISFSWVALVYQVHAFISRQLTFMKWIMRYTAVTVDAGLSYLPFLPIVTPVSMRFC